MPLSRNTQTALVLFISSLLIAWAYFAAKERKIPDDIRYMLEEMYGSVQQNWPVTFHTRDLNKDGFTDWIAVSKKCSDLENCAVEIFVCRPGSDKRCEEYCYLNVKTLKDIESRLQEMKCESTC